TVLDAAHAIAFQCRRNLAIRKQSHQELLQQLATDAAPRVDPFQRIHKREVHVEPDIHKVPIEPEEDVLLFIRDHNPYLAEWQKDLLTIVHESTQYFLPQIETKIMNEGWATYWHKRILDSLELPQELHLEFIVRHNQVVRPTPGGLNPYHLGLRVWEDIFRRYEEPTGDEIRSFGPGGRGLEKLFETREVDRDTSFLRRHLTENLVRDLNLFEYQAQGDDVIATHVADEEGWRAVKETLVKSVGMNSFPVIKIVDADYGRNRTLYLAHEHDGRDLQLDYAEKTLAYLYSLWQREVALETVLSGVKTLLGYGEQGFVSKSLK
ncbi:MAG TPA: SpoVR family protein, partial [Terriglobales bacterium]|nr:SpoVR family protein [Terriglobales bacterium]